MRFPHHMLAAILALAPSGASAQQPAYNRQGDTPIPITMSSSATGTITGWIAGSEEDPRQETIVIDDGSTKQTFLTDEQGHFSRNVPAGVYKAYIKTPPGEGDKRAQYPTFYVGANQVIRVPLDPTYEYVYCSRSGDKVMPARSSHAEDENLRGLRRPNYDSYPIKFSRNITLRNVIQHCGKAPISRLILYRSPLFKANEYSLALATARFNPQTQALEGSSGFLYRHGEPSVSAPYVTAKLSGRQPFINMTGKTYFSAKGEGTINRWVTFDFNINAAGVYKFNYVDQTGGLKLSSKEEGGVLVMKSSKDGVTISGSGVVTKADDPKGEIHDFKVTVQDRGDEEKKNDLFSISIPSLMNYHQSGRVTSGDINVSRSLNNTGVQEVKTSPFSSSRMNLPVRMRRP